MRGVRPGHGTRGIRIVRQHDSLLGNQQCARSYHSASAASVLDGNEVAVHAVGPLRREFDHARPQGGQHPRHRWIGLWAA